MIYTREDLFEMREEMAEYRDRIRSKLKAAPEGRIMITERNGRSNYFRNLYDEKGDRTLHDMPSQITDMSGNIINIRKLSDIQKLIMAESGTQAPVDMTRLEKEVRREIMEAWAATPYIRNQILLKI